MAEIGNVTEVKGDYVVVALNRNEACGTCKACTAGLSGTTMYIEAKNDCNAKIHDAVEIHLGEVHFIKAVGIMYGIPLVGLVVGILLGVLLFESELLMFLLGIVIMAICFLLIKINEKRFKTDNYRPVAVRVHEKVGVSSTQDS